MNNKKISVKLMPPSTIEHEQEKVKYFEERIFQKINNSIKSDWAIKYEELGYNSNTPIYSSYISTINNEEFHKIKNIIITQLRDIQFKKLYPILSPHETPLLKNSLFS